MRYLFASLSIVLFFLINFSFSLAVLAGEQIDIAPPPNWVSILELPKSDPALEKKSTKGIHYLLASNQVRYRDNKRQVYSRYAFKVIEREGLEEAGSIQVSFRPELDSLTIHDVRIIRDKRVIVLSKKLKFDVIRRETEIEKGILDGVLTAYARLPKIKVGDIVEYSYSISYKSILMPEHYFGEFSMSHSTPSEILERRIIVPKIFDISIKYRNLEMKPKISVSGDEITYNWTVENSAIVKTESNAPDWSVVHKYIEVSSIRSWREVAENSISHYSRDDELTDDFKILVDEIGATSKSNEEKLARILSLVQNEVRYVGIEIGRGAFVPRLPSEVIASGYGDCKDKSYLMVKALHRLNINAVPTLAHLTKGKDLINRLPSPYVFNHVIVRATINGKKYWVDPTGTYEDNLDPQFAQVNYGYVLPIEKNVEGLERIVIEEPKDFDIEISEIYTVNYTGEKPLLELEVTTKYIGAGADVMRRNIAATGESNLEENYLEYYQRTFEKIENVSDLEIFRDDVTRRILTVEKYKLRDVEDKNKLFKDFPFKPEGISSILLKAEKGRVQPLKLSYPFSRKYTIRVQNLDYDYESFDPIKFKTPYLDYSYTGKVDGDSIEMTWKLKTKRDHVKPVEIARYFEIRDAVFYNEGNSYDLTLPMAVDEEPLNEAIMNFDLKDILVLTFIIGFIPLMFFGLRYGLSADSEYREEGTYFPVSIFKYITMSIITGGIYIIFWHIKYWLWHNEILKSKIIAYVKSLFSSYSLFFAIGKINNEKQLANKISRSMQIFVSCIAIGVSVFEITDIFLADEINDIFKSNLRSDFVDFSLSIGAVLIYTLCSMPLVLKVNSLNEFNNGPILKNSKFNIWNLVGFLMCLVFVFWVYIL